MRAKQTFRGSAVGVVAALLAMALALTLPLVQATDASAVQVPQDLVVSADPADYTPDVMDGSVESIVQVGDRIVVAGDFQQIKEKGSQKPVLDQAYLFAFDPASGAIDQSFMPTLDGDVRVVLPAADGRSVYAAGSFNTVNGVVSRKLTRLELPTGAITEGFEPGPFNARVVDLRLIGEELIVAGRFDSAAGQERSGLASVNADTGKLTPFMAPVLADPRSGDKPFALKLDLTPDMSRLIVIGNFATVDGQSRPQLALFDTSAATATLAAWRSPFFSVSTCSTSFQTYMRDVDIDPTGTYFVVSTTGAYRGSTSPCDVIARFEVQAAGSDIAPTWRNYTGGDTSYAVAVTGPAIYVGGHMRWVNNPWAGDRAGAGAVPRSGIVALDPLSGMPLTWDPGRDPRGVGVFDILATDSGLYIGSDTEYVAGERHRRLAFFPIAGGTRNDPVATGALPNDVYLLGDFGRTQDVMRRAYVDGTGTPGEVDITTGDLNGSADWRNARGAALVGDQVFTAWSDGTLRSHNFDGIQFGDAEDVPLYGTSWSRGAAYWFGSDAADVTGMFFDPADNRIYYTMAGSSQLHWRGFAPESGILGAARFPATGDIAALGPQRVAGAFLSGNTLYFADSETGILHQIGFERGVVSGPATAVNDDIDWRSAGAFLWSGEPAKPVADPVAAFTATCAGLLCQFDGNSSSDSDGVVVEWDWSIGQSTAAGPLVTYEFAAPGSQDVTLTVTDNRGRTNTTTQVVTVAEVSATQLQFRDAQVSTTTSTVSNITIPASVEQGDLLLLFATVNTTADLVEAPTGWQLRHHVSGIGMESRLLTRVADATDAGTVLQLEHSLTSKTDLTLVAYGGDPGAAIREVAATAETGSTATHFTPGVPNSPETRLVVSYWADKSSATTDWMTPSDQEQRTLSVGKGSGRISSVLTDGAVEPAPVGAVPGLAATADSASRKATMFSVSIG